MKAEEFEQEWKRYCDSKGSGAVTMSIKDMAQHFAKYGYEQAIKDIKETFEEMSNNTNSAIDAVKVLCSLLDNPDIRKKLGKSKPMPKKPVKTNPFFGGEKK